MNIIKNTLSLFVLILSVQILVAQNYDESKVPPYTLPELLQSQDGSKITTKKEWEKPIEVIVKWNLVN